MRTPARGRLTPSLVISLLALFISLGGTGYAASKIDLGSAAASHKPAKPLTSKQVNKLIATYLAAHHIGAKGPEGKQGIPGTPGTPGSPGGKGDQGPGATRIVLNTTSASGAGSVAIGPWTLSTDCAPSETDIAVEGPEYKYAETESLGKIGETAKVLNFNEERGVSASIPSGDQELLTAVIYSGTAMEHLELEITDEPGLFNSCRIIGSATPAA